MKLFTLPQFIRHGFRAFNTPSVLAQIRSSSTHSQLHKQLTSRPPNVIYDYLSPTPSHLLNISLLDFLPISCCPPSFTSSDLTFPLAGDAKDSLLPQGHHLVYFSSQIPSSALLPDGTDSLHSPGPPFVRRMWAGGSLLFNPVASGLLRLDNRRVACTERIADVSVKGNEGEEKVFVKIERRVELVSQKYISRSPDSGNDKASESDLGDIKTDNQCKLKLDPLYDMDFLSKASLVETRNIVFMREKSMAAAKEDVARPGKIVKAPYSPDFAVPIVPTQSLLFRFSALTFNAHAIHLDAQYACNVEGYRNLLVHGPLTLVLMLSVLRSQLKGGKMVTKFDYRNLAPLYADEELRVCVRKDPVRQGNSQMEKYDVWIEGRGGAYAVKGSALVSYQLSKV